MDDRDTTKPVVIAALVLAWVAGGFMVADLVDGAGSAVLTTVQVLLALVALGCALAMMRWSGDRGGDDTIIDLRDEALATPRVVRATTEARSATVH